MELRNINTSQEKFDSTKSGGFQEIGRLKEGVSTHRVITGPMSVSTVWFPTIVEKEGKLIQSVRAVVRPPEGCVIDELAKLDEEATRKKMREEGASDEEIKKFRSSLRPKTTYRFLVFDRELDAEGAPTVRVFEYPYSIKDQLEALQKTKSKKHPGFLEFGLIFMYDLYIEKVKDPKIKNALYATSYAAQVVTDTLPFVTKQQRISESWLNPKGDLPWKLEDYFTEQELQAIIEFPKELDDFCKPDSQEDIVKKLTDFPIFVNAVHQSGDMKNTPMFPALMDPEIQEQVMEKYKEILMLKEAEIVEEPKKLSNPAKLGAPKVEIQQETPKALIAKPSGFKNFSMKKPPAEEIQAEVVKEEEKTEVVKPAAKKLFFPKKV